MFTAIHDFLVSLFNFDLLSSNPKDYFTGGWGDFKGIFSTLKEAISS